MNILSIFVVVQSFNLVVLAWFNRVDLPDKEYHDRGIGDLIALQQKANYHRSGGTWAERHRS